MADKRLGAVLTQAAGADVAPSHAPSRLKSRIYSALMRAEASESPIRSTSETLAEGRGLCVFEQLIEIAPLGSAVKQYNYCRVCHARILGEWIEDPPIYWNCCPYAEFKNS
jgi:hypothetical protein